MQFFERDDQTKEVKLQSNLRSGAMHAFTVFVGVISFFGAVDITSSSFSAHGKIGNFIIMCAVTIHGVIEQIT